MVTISLNFKEPEWDTLPGISLLQLLTICLPTLIIIIWVLFKVVLLIPNPMTDDDSVSRYRLGGHLSSPIVLDDCNFLLQQDKFYCKRHNLLKQKLKNAGIVKHIYDVCPSPWMCLVSYIRSIPQDHKTQSLIDHSLHQSVKAAIKNMVSQASVYLQERLNLDLYNPEVLQSLILKNHIITTSYKHKRSAELLKNRMTQCTMEFGSMMKLTPSIILEKEVFFFNCPYHGRSIGPTTLFTGCLDIVQTRFTLYTYWFLRDYFDLSLDSIFDTGVKIVSTIERLWVELKEDLFKVLKNWDSYVIGIICSDEHHDTGFHNLLTAASSEIQSVYPEFFTSGLASLFIPHIPSESQIKQALELSTLSRSFGHPVLDDIKGMKALKEGTCKKLNIDPTIVLYVRNMFVKTFIKGYIQKENKWPQVSFTGVPNLTLYKAYLSNRWLTDVELQCVSIEDWGPINFQKISEFDKSVDTSELLSDKSCAPPLPYWTQKYDPCGFRVLHNQTKPKLPIQETRVILRYLKGVPNETDKAVSDVIAGRPNQENNLTFQTRKERELKSDGGRTFCSQTYLQRLIQVATEANIKKFVYKYLPQQTMSDTELGLYKKIASFLKLQNDGGDIINLDLSKWNVFQRHESVFRISKDLDDMFGTPNLFTDSHLWMQRCFVLNNNRTAPPAIHPKTGLPVPGPSCHIGQEGGFEGMRQKLWTIGTICTILYVAESLNLKVSVIGQGDNQVALVKYTSAQLVSRIEHRERFLTELESVFSRQGLKLKLEETWISTRLLEYGKKRWFKGVPVNNGTKRATRIIPDESDGLITTEVSLATLATGTENIANNDISAFPAFILYGIEFSNWMFRMEIATYTTTEINLLALLHWPNILGGLIVSNFPNHCVRGLDDPLTCWLSLLRGLWNHYPEVFDQVCRLIPLKFKATRDYERLIEDIFSLNIPTLVTASLQLKEDIKEFLPMFTTNREVLDILSLNTSDTPALIACLMNMTPFYAPLANGLYRNSNTGMIKQKQGKLINIQSIKKVADALSNFELYNKILDTDNNLRLLIHNRLHKLNKQDTPQLPNTGKLKMIICQQDLCTYQEARALRIASWGVEPLGATHPCPWEQFGIAHFEALPQLLYNSTLTTVLSEEFRSTSRLSDLQLGPYPCYFGSVTQIKRTKTTRLDQAENVPFMNTVRELLTYYSWALRIGSQGLINICKLLLRQKMALFPPSVTLEDLIQDIDTIYGGHMFHRLRSVVESRGSLLNTLTTATSHMKTTSSSFINITYKGDDFNIFFQLIYLYIQSVLIHIRVQHPRFIFPSEYHSYLKCPKCTHKLQDANVQLPSVVFLLPNNEDQLGTLLRETLQVKNLNPDPALDPYIRRDLSLKVGRDIALDIQENQYYVYAERDLGDLLEATSFYSTVNLVELRDADLPYVIIGLLIHSRILRSIIIGRKPEKIIKPQRVLQPLTQALIESGRLSDFFLLNESCNTNPLVGVSLSATTQIVYDIILKFYDSYECEILRFIFRASIILESGNPHTSHLPSFVKYTVLCLIKHLLNELNKFDSLIKIIKDNISTLRNSLKTFLVFPLQVASSDKYKLPLASMCRDKTLQILIYKVVQEKNQSKPCSCPIIYDSDISTPLLMLLEEKDLRHISQCSCFGYDTIIFACAEYESETGQSSILATICKYIPMNHLYKYLETLPKNISQDIKDLHIQLSKYADMKQNVFNQLQSLNQIKNKLRNDTEMGLYHHIYELSGLDIFKEVIGTIQDFQSCSIRPYNDVVLHWRQRYVGSFRKEPTNFNMKEIPEPNYFHDTNPSSLLLRESDDYLHPCISYRPGVHWCEEQQKSNQTSYTLPYSDFMLVQSITRPYGLIDSSPNNFIVPLARIEQAGVVPTHIINLAGGSGSTLQLATILFPNAWFAFNTLSTSTTSNLLDSSYSIPSSLYGSSPQLLEQIIQNSYTLMHGETDITKNSFTNKLQDCLSKITPENNIILIVSDLDTTNICTWNSYYTQLFSLIDYLQNHNKSFIYIGNINITKDIVFSSHPIIQGTSNTIISTILHPLSMCQGTSMTMCLISNIMKLKEVFPPVPIHVFMEYIMSEIRCLCENISPHISISSSVLGLDPVIQDLAPPTSQKNINSVLDYNRNMVKFMNTYRALRNITYIYHPDFANNTFSCESVLQFESQLHDISWETVSGWNPLVERTVRLLGRNPVILNILSRFFYILYIDAMNIHDEQEWKIFFTIISNYKISYKAVYKPGIRPTLKIIPQLEEKDGDMCLRKYIHKIRPLLILKSQGMSGCRVADLGICQHIKPDNVVESEDNTQGLVSLPIYWALAKSVKRIYLLIKRDVRRM